MQRKPPGKEKIKAPHQAEIESQALRSRFAYLLKYANDIIILADEDQHVVEANDRALEIYGYTLEEMLGLPMAALIPPDDLSSYRGRLRKLQKEGAIVAEGIHKRKDGSTFPVEVSARPLKIEGKQYIQAIIRDITERKRAEEALRESEERFRAFFEEAPVYHYMVSSEGKILDVNKAALETLGYTREEIIGKPLITTVYAPSSRKKAERLFIKWKEAGKIEDEELNIITRKGDERTVLLSAHAIRDAEGKALYSISVQRDVTERMQVEEALRKSEEQYRFLVELSPEAIFVASEGKHVFTNSAGLKLLGASSPHQIVGKPVMDIIHPDYREVVAERMRGAMETGTAPPVMEEKFVRLDGTVIDVEVKGAPLVYRGKPAMQVFVSDITERKRVQESLRLSEQNFRDSIENSLLGIRVLDKDGKTIYANRAMLDMWGYSSIKELEAVPAKQRYTPESYDEHIKRIEDLKIGEDIPFTYEASIVRSDGQVRHVSASTRALTWRGEKQIQVVYQDITERKQAEAEYRTIIRATMDGFWLTDMQGHSLDVNDAFCRLIGYSREELRQPNAYGR